MAAAAAALLIAVTAAGLAAAEMGAPIPVPSGAEVRLQEVLSDPVPGMGLVRRYRFVMPALADLVPPVPEGDLMDNLPADMVDEPAATDQPLSAEDRALLDEGLGDLAIEAVPAEGGDAPWTGLGADDGMSGDAPLPGELAAPDPGPAPGAAAPSPEAEAEAAGDLAGEDQDFALPPAPDALMQDPVHQDIVWLCEHYALPEVVGLTPRPSQIVISMASAPSEFGTFDPEVVQLFEGFSVPADRDACVWEPM